jgi:hypothetical protein
MGLALDIPWKQYSLSQAAIIISTVTKKATTDK